MHKFDPSRVMVIALAALSLAVVAIGLVTVYHRGRSHAVTIAAGGSGGESFAIAQALKAVAERHYPRLRLKIQETGGTTENLRLLESGAVQFAAAQSDVPAGPSARAVIYLYPDVFQLLVRDSRALRRFPDLAGQRIALSRAGGQYRSFLSVAAHFGLREQDFEFVGTDDAAADQAFADGRADAVFRVRALGNPAIARLVRGGQAQFVPIGQAAAMRIRIPAFVPAVIPEGSYLGNPPIPPQDLPSVAVERTLLTHRDTEWEPVNWVTAILMEHRQEMAEAIPERHAEVRALLAGVQRPVTEGGLGAPLHEGAQDFFDKDKPSFVHEQADVLALVVTLMVLVGSWVWELKRWISRRQKNQADQYSNQVILLMNRAKVTRSTGELDRMRSELLDLLTRAVHDLDVDRLSEESFQSFRAIWQITQDVMRERRLDLAEEPSGSHAAGAN